jgi:hypothetical protein
MSARIPNVKYTTAIGARKRLNITGTPMKEATNDTGILYAKNMRKPTIMSIMPIMMCNIVNIATLAGRLRADVKNATPNPKPAEDSSMDKKPSHSHNANNSQLSRFLQIQLQAPLQKSHEFKL